MLIAKSLIYEIFGKFLNMYITCTCTITHLWKNSPGGFIFFTQVDSCSSMQIDSFSTLHRAKKVRGIRKISLSLFYIPDFNVKN